MTSERIDHVAEALNNLGAFMAENYRYDERKVARAQVHATLALVEQERIRNLIAVHSADESIERWDQWPTIAAALGLKP